jgi:hypothetical protein
MPFGKSKLKKSQKEIINVRQKNGEAGQPQVDGLDNLFSMTSPLLLYLHL